MKKDLSDVIHMLKITLIWYDFTGSRFANIKLSFQYVRLIVNIITWFSAVFSMYLEGFPTNFDGRYYYCAMLFLCWCHLLEFCINQKKVENIVHKFQELMKSQNDTSLDEKDLKNMLIAIKFYVSNLFIFALSYYISPVIIDICLAIFSPDSKIFKVPFCFDSLLDDGVRNKKYYFIVIYQGIWVMENMLTHAGSIGILSIFVMYLGIQIKILAQKIDTFSADVLKRDALYNPTLTKKETEALKDLVKHHIEILSLTEQIKEYFGFAYVIQNLVAAFCLGLTMISTVNLLDKEEYFLVAMNLLSCFMVVVLSFTACYVGEYLHTQNTFIYYKICNIPWYALNSKTRKDVGLIMALALRERGIDFHDMSALKLHTFMQIMHAAYSYFMVLRSRL